MTDADAYLLVWFCGFTAGFVIACWITLRRSKG